MVGSCRLEPPSAADLGPPFPPDPRLTGYMDFNTLSLKLPGGLSFSLMRYWDGQVSVRAGQHHVDKADLVSSLLPTFAGLEMRQ